MEIRYVQFYCINKVFRTIEATIEATNEISSEQQKASEIQLLIIYYKAK